LSSLGRAAAPVAIITFDEVERDEIRRLERILDETFGAPAVVLPAVPLPEGAFDPERRQFDADQLLDQLFARLPERCLRVVGVTAADLYIRGRTFVFGYAHLTDGMAIYSLARLREQFYGRAGDAARLDARVRRAAIHEFGHTFGVPHCTGPRCVMNTVTHVETLDALDVEYCETCHERVAEGLVTPPWSAHGRRARAFAFLRRRAYRQAVVELQHAVACSPLDPSLRQALDFALAAAGGSATIAA
jgi:archaemetzincin